MILRSDIRYGACFVFTKMMENLKSARWASGAANSSAARYLDKARPKEEANFCDLFIKSYFLSEPCVSCCYALLATSEAVLVTMKKQEHKNAGTFFWASVTYNITLQFGNWVTMFDYVALDLLIFCYSDISL